jgi:hypothetical protein
MRDRISLASPIPDPATEVADPETEVADLATEVADRARARVKTTCL